LAAPTSEGDTVRISGLIEAKPEHRSSTAGRVAQQVEPDPIIDSKTKTNRLAWLLTTTYSLANVPALSLPCGFHALQDGTALPIGLQIAGKPFAEVTVFKQLLENSS